ncbi:MAG TPA: hypothetical protein VMV07_07685 [Streptosporangiaceae bacterium]|nr:hypothetical protein [Streptosporangiaceae bacterium]
MQDTTYSPGPLLAELRAGLRGMRAARAARKTLRRDLAGVRTPADFIELDAILERYNDDETADIRHVLNERRAAARQLPTASAFSGWSAAGE